MLAVAKTIGTVLLGHLDRGQPDATAGGVNEHTVAGLQLRPVEREPDRQRRSGNGRRIHRTHPVRHRRQQLGRHIEPAGERALHEAEDALADLESGDAATQLRDDAGEVAADRSGIARVEAEHVEHVPEVEARGLHPDLHVALVRRRHVRLGQPQVVDRAAFGGRQDVVGSARHREMTAARPRQ